MTRPQESWGSKSARRYPALHGQGAEGVADEQSSAGGRRTATRRGPQLAQSGTIQLDGDVSVLATLAGLIDGFDPNFEIIVP